VRPTNQKEAPQPSHCAGLRSILVALACAAAVLHVLALAALAQDFSCRGDCNGDGAVTIDELIKAINIALGSATVSECPALLGCFEVDVTCLVGAVNNALIGCPVEPATPTQTTSQAPQTPTATPTNSTAPSLTATSTPNPSSTATATITATASPTPTPVPGPAITFFGLATASGAALPSAGMDPQGIPIYSPLYGAGFIIVVEAKPGRSGASPGTKSLNSDPSDPTARPDIQIEANRNLGNGSAAVCDIGPLPNPLGGIPGFDPPSFDPTSQMVADALNDFGCRFAAHTASDPCTLSDSGNPKLVAPDTAVQFCSASVVGHESEFQQGDTLLTVQWRDNAAVPNLSLPSRIIVRVPEGS